MDYDEEWLQTQEKMNQYINEHKDDTKDWPEWKKKGFLRLEIKHKCPKN